MFALIPLLPSRSHLQGGILEHKVGSQSARRRSERHSNVMYPDISEDIVPVLC